MVGECGVDHRATGHPAPGVPGAVLHGTRGWGSRSVGVRNGVVPIELSGSQSERGSSGRTSSSTEGHSGRNANHRRPTTAAASSVRHSSRRSGRGCMPEQTVRPEAAFGLDRRSRDLPNRSIGTIEHLWIARSTRVRGRPRSCAAVVCGRQRPCECVTQRTPPQGKRRVEPKQRSESGRHAKQL